jgi:hypothetical protein
LGAPPRFNFAGVQVPFRIGDYFVHMMELACVPARMAGAAQHRSITSAQCPDDIVFAVCYE